MGDQNYCQCVSQLFTRTKVAVLPGQFGLYFLVAKGTDPNACVACLNQLQAAHAGDGWAPCPAFPNYFLKCHYSVCPGVLSDLPSLL
jgi:hypothetical protein